MPKINVYLPDELAEAVKEAGVPVSTVCQRALERAVQRVTAIRQTALSDVDVDNPTGATERFTPRARASLKFAAAHAREAGAPEIGTEHLLGGILTEGGNLALHVLRALDIEPEQVRRDLDRQMSAKPAETGDADPRRFDAPAANALEIAVTEAVSFGHNYIGCEHMLLGLVTEPDGTAGQVLRALGAEPRLTRRAVTAALAGYLHLRTQDQQKGATTLATTVREELEPLIQRLDRLERHVGLTEAG
jgi:ATP-dependent Clp protease ATP-binding subunit ClpC